MPTPVFPQLNPQDEFERRAALAFQGDPVAPAAPPAPFDITGSGEQPTGAMASLVGSPADPALPSTPAPMPVPTAPSPQDAAAIADAQQMADIATGVDSSVATKQADVVPQPDQPAPNQPAPTSPPLDANSQEARDQAFNAGISALDQADKLDQANATRDTHHWDEATGTMVEGGNNILDEEEMKSHVSTITSAWQEAEEGIKARVAEDYRQNLEQLQNEQHQIRAKYSAMVDEVANTSINPSELWDKGGFGSRIGIPGAAALDTFYAMKGWNVPSFSAPWDKMVESNIKAQESALTQKTSKLAGLQKLWDMAGTISSNRKEQIGFTSDLLKAVTMGQYVHQLAPFKSLAAAADAQAIKAKAMREIGKTHMARWDMMDRNALARKAQLDADTLARLKAGQKGVAAQHLAQARGAGDWARGNANVGKNGDATQAGWEAYNQAMTAPNGQVSPKRIEQWAPAIAQLATQNVVDVMARIAAPKSKPGEYNPIIQNIGGVRRLVGIYDSSKGNGALKDVQDATLKTSELEGLLTDFNDGWREVLKEYGGDPTVAGLGDYKTHFLNRLKGERRNLSEAETNVLSIWQKVSTQKRHELAGANQTKIELGNMDIWLPNSLNSGGKINFGVSGAMRFAAEEQLRNLHGFQNNGTLHLVSGNPITDAEKSLNMLAGAVRLGNPLDVDMNTEIDKTRAFGRKPVKADAEDSALTKGAVLDEDGVTVKNITAPDAVKAFINVAKGVPYDRLGPAEQKSYDKLKNLPGQAEAEVTRVWNEDKASWTGVMGLMKGASAELAQVKRELPADKQYKFDKAIKDINALYATAKLQDEKIRDSAAKKAGMPGASKDVLEELNKPTYDHTLAERADSTEARNLLAKQYRDILESVYSDPNALQDPAPMRNPSMLAIDPPTGK